MAARPRVGLSLCSGGGGLDLGLGLAEPGFRTACYVEWEEYPRSVLIAAQEAGYMHPAPIWSDLTTFDARPWRGAVDTVLAGYPCQPFSQAGQRRGEDDERHLWPDVARVIRECQPEWVFLENVAGHVSLGAEAVLRELWGMGWTPAAGLFSAEEVGATHERLRWFCVAHRDDGCRSIQPQRREPDERRRLGNGGEHVDHPSSPRRDGAGERQPAQSEGGQRLLGDGRAELAHAGGTRAETWRPKQNQRQQGDANQLVNHSRPLFPPAPDDRAAWADTLADAPHLAPAASGGDLGALAARLAADCEEPHGPTESDIRRLAHGLAARSRALRLLGNGVVPLVAGYAWRSLATAHGLGPVDLEAASRDYDA